MTNQSEEPDIDPFPATKRDAPIAPLFLNLIRDSELVSNPFFAPCRSTALAA